MRKYAQGFLVLKTIGLLSPQHAITPFFVVRDCVDATGHSTGHVNAFYASSASLRTRPFYDVRRGCAGVNGTVMVAWSPEDALDVEV